MIDPTALLAELDRTLRLVRRRRSARRRDPTASLDTTLDPYGVTPARAPKVATLATFEELTARVDDPMGPRLAAWVYALTLDRVYQTTEQTFWTQRSQRWLSPNPSLAAPTASFRSLVGDLVTTGEAGARAPLGAQLVTQADAVSAAAAELWSLRGEAAQRFRVVPPEAPLLPFADPLEPLAEQVLARTDDLLRRELRSAITWADALALGAGVDVAAPWPLRLSPSSLTESFRGEAGWLDVPGLDLGVLPPVRNGASFLRALARLGARWADAAASRTLPLALAHTPHGLTRFSLGATFGGLLLRPDFITKTFAFSRNETERVVRSQARTMLVAWRLAAARILMRSAALRGNLRTLRQVAQEATSRALDRDVPPGFALALPRLHLTDPARFLAWGEGARQFARLRSKHDEDWVRNPRTAADLRDQLDQLPLWLLNPADAAAGIDELLGVLTEALA